LFFTNYPTKTIEQVSTDGKASTFAKLTAFPLGLISTAEGYLVTAHGTSLLTGQDVSKSQQLILLDKTGKQTGQFDAPEAMLLNGMVRLNNGAILVADSLAGTIWQVDVKAKKLTPWLQDASLAPLANQEHFKPGANGLKLRSDGLIVSNTSRGTLSLIKIGEDGMPASKPELISEIGMIDDFWVNKDDSIVFTTHEDSIKLLSAEGKVSVVATEHCLGNTAIVPYPANQSKTFAVTTDGGMYFGAKDPAVVVLVTVPGSK